MHSCLCFVFATTQENAPFVPGAPANKWFTTLASECKCLRRAHPTRGPHAGCRLTPLCCAKILVSFAPPQPSLKAADSRVESCARSLGWTDHAQPKNLRTDPGAFCHARAVILTGKGVEHDGIKSCHQQHSGRLKVTAVPASSCCR